MTLRNAFADLALDSTVQRLPRNAWQFAAGQYRNAGNAIAVAAGATGVYQLSNPADSGVLVTTTQITLAATATAEVRFMVDTTLNAPTVLAPWTPNRASPNTTTKAIARSGVTGATGGSALSPRYLLPLNRPEVLDFTCVLAPGQSISAQLTTPGLTATTFYGSATWIEEAL